MNLSDRKKYILKAIVEQYINTAEPVGSKAIMQILDFSLSSATIRNEMAELEEMGLLLQPHTSAGRIPSVKGYRLYVNELMAIPSLSVSEEEDFKRMISFKANELDRLLSEAGRLLSEITNYTTVAVSPKLSSAFLKRIEIVSYDCYNHIIILITSNGIVKNRSVRTQHVIFDNEIKSLAGSLNMYLTGPMAKSLSDVFHILSGLCSRGVRELLNEIFVFIDELYAELSSRNVYLGGITNLLNYPEFSDINVARELMEFISHNRSADAFSFNSPDVIKILIGNENKIDALKNSTIIMTSYNLGGNDTGFIGIIGPTRIDYAKMSARLDRFARNLNLALQQLFIDKKESE